MKIVALYGAVPVADEGYYLLWGQNLDWSYYDHPPLGGWMLGLSSAVLGDNPGRRRYCLDHLVLGQRAH